MTDYIEDGFLWVSDGSDYLKVQCEKIWYWLVIEPTIKHYNNEGHMFYDLKKRYWMILAEGIWLKTHTDWKDFQKYLLDWHDDGPFYVRVHNGDPPILNTTEVEFYDAGSYVKVLSMAIAKNGLKRGSKQSVGTQEYWKIESVMFEQAG